jgi:hypothetical protein
MVQLLKSSKKEKESSQQQILLKMVLIEYYLRVDHAFTNHTNWKTTLRQLTQSRTIIPSLKKINKVDRTLASKKKSDKNF